jgi:hypothetical protein
MNDKNAIRAVLLTWLVVRSVVPTLRQHDDSITKTSFNAPSRRRHRDAKSSTDSIVWMI